MALTPSQQSLVDDIVRLVSRGSDRPCTTFSPDPDPHERFRVTVCEACRFPEAFHLLARSLEAIAGARAEAPVWDPSRDAAVRQLFGDLRQRIVQRASIALIDAALQGALSYALEPRPSTANEREAAKEIRAVVEAAKDTGVVDGALSAAIAAAKAWLDKYDSETPSEEATRIAAGTPPA